MLPKRECICKKFCDFSDSPEILLPAFRTETEIGIQPVPDVVAVKNICPYGVLEQNLLHAVRDR